MAGLSTANRIKRLASPACRENHHRADWTKVSKHKHGKSTIWQRRFWEHQGRNEEDFIRHADYIHFSPVKYGNVRHVREWLHSTFHRFFCDEIMEMIKRALPILEDCL